MSLTAARRWIVFFSAVVIGMAMSRVVESQTAPAEGSSAELIRR